MLDPRSLGLLAGLILVVLYFSWLLRKQAPWAMLVVWVYFLVHALYTGLSPYYMPKAVTAPVYVHLMRQGLTQALALVALPLFVLFVGPVFLRWLLRLFVWLLALDAVWFLSGGVFGLLNSYSFDTSVMALFLPMIMHRKPKCLYQYIQWAICFLYIAAIIKTRSTTAILTMAVGLFVLHFSWWAMGLGALFVATMGFLGDVHHRTLLYSSGRLQAWEHYLTWWDANVNHFVGLGSGSFEILGPLLPVKDMHLAIMHNDYLQILFENGWIGLCLFLALVVWASYWLRGTGAALAVGVAYLVCMMAYFPLHFFIPQIIGLVVLRNALEEWRVGKRKRGSFHSPSNF